MILLQTPQEAWGMRGPNGMAGLSSSREHGNSIKICRNVFYSFQNISKTVGELYIYLDHMQCWTGRIECSLQMHRLSLRINTPVEVHQDFRGITNHILYRICGICIKSVKRKPGRSQPTWNWLETRGFWPIMLKNLGGHWSSHGHMSKPQVMAMRVVLYRNNLIHTKLITTRWL